MVDHINYNAYKLDLPGKYSVHATFNVTDLSPFLANDELDLGTNRLQKEGNDTRVMADHDSLRVDQMELSGPMTRARAKKLKESMQALVRSIHDGVDLANVTRELEKDEATRYTLVQVVEPNEEELGASFEV